MLKVNFRVVTWNVGCNEIFKKRFPHIMLEDKFRKITSRLSSVIDGNLYNSTEQSNQQVRPIIHLQELDIKQISKYHLFFLGKGYHFFHTSYGNIRDGHMGVATAVPTECEIKDVKYVNPIVDYLSDEDESYDEHNNWKNVMLKTNRYIAINVSYCGGKSFWVVNCHLPVMYKSPEHMIAYTTILLESIKSYTYDNDRILAGDFNVQSKDKAYKLYQGIKVAHALPDEGCPHNYPKSKLVRYNECLNLKGKTPITTRSSIRSGNGIFAASLDHIFYTGNVLESVGLEDVENLKRSIPDNDEPSDHLPIVGKFSVVVSHN